MNQAGKGWPGIYTILVLASICTSIWAGHKAWSNPAATKSAAPAVGKIAVDANITTTGKGEILYTPAKPIPGAASQEDIDAVERIAEAKHLRWWVQCASSDSNEMYYAIAVDSDNPWGIFIEDGAKPHWFEKSSTQSGATGKLLRALQTGKPDFFPTHALAPEKHRRCLATIGTDRLNAITQVCEGDCDK